MCGLILSYRETTSYDFSMAGIAIFGANTNLFAVIGALAASYAALQLVCSIWSGLKAYVLGKSLGLSANLKKMGQWAGTHALHPNRFLVLTCIIVTFIPQQQ